ncbi:MAG: hypothetical protein HC836_07810 [Richelia sp. RM2_1_2]|nr:hypothetical protein [Richelia sp. SM2_1_7]NJM21176.1 hypothetical protein [Richelia sp. SM1_7_0]NJN08081.1 hypothetical protein [Richelia sp. RM1_1_1]NJO58260.1 hypothetical protein [Richelia sp. RM2_1_2]
MKRIFDNNIFITSKVIVSLEYSNHNQNNNKVGFWVRSRVFSELSVTTDIYPKNPTSAIIVQLRLT